MGFLSSEKRGASPVVVAVTMRRGNIRTRITSGERYCDGVSRIARNAPRISGALRIA